MEAAECRTMIERLMFFFKFQIPIFVKTNVKRATANVMPGAVAEQPADQRPAEDLSWKVARCHPSGRQLARSSSCTLHLAKSQIHM